MGALTEITGATVSVLKVMLKGGLRLPALSAALT